MKLVFTCLVLLLSMYIGNANAMVYERVIKVTNDHVIRTWSMKMPACSEVINDCVHILNKDEATCSSEAAKLAVVEKCFNTLTKEKV